MWFRRHEFPNFSPIWILHFKFPIISYIWCGIFVKMINDSTRLFWYYLMIRIWMSYHIREMFSTSNCPHQIGISDNLFSSNYIYALCIYAYFCEMLFNAHADAHCTKPAKATLRRIEFSCLVGKRRRPPAILFENIPRDQSYDERRFCCSNGFVNKIGRVVGRDRQKIYWYIHRYISAWDDAKRSFFPSSFVRTFSSRQRKRRLTMRLKMLVFFFHKRNIAIVNRDTYSFPFNCQRYVHTSKY